MKKSYTVINKCTIRILQKVNYFRMQGIILLNIKITKNLELINK
jgi:hypothetical protein